MPAVVASEPRHRARRRAVAVRARSRSSVGVTANTARIVSLNWRMLANPLANAICESGTSVVSMRIRARLRPLRAGERDRTGPDLGDELPVQVALAVVELAGEAGDALAVDDAVRDQAHRPPDEVGALVPLRRSRRRVRPAPLAGPEAGELGRGRGGEEAHVARAWGSGPGSSAGSRCRCS